MEDDVRPWADEDDRRLDSDRPMDWDLTQYASEEEVPFEIPRD